MAPPAFDHHLGLAQRVEDLALQQLVAQAGVEALHASVLPRAAGRDAGGSRAHGADPGLDPLGHELGAVVRADVPGHAAQDEQVGQHVDHVSGSELAPDPDGQALVGELVDDVEHPELAAIMGAVLHEVVRPDVVRPLRLEPEAGAVGQPQPPALGLPRRDLEPLPASDPPHPFVVHQPARRGPRQGRDLAVAVAAVPARELEMVSAVSCSSSSRPRGSLRCVERC